MTNKPLRIALTKGRLEKDTVGLFEKIGFKGAITSRSMELDATPPENTTRSPGYAFSACSVARYTAFATHRRA